ARSPAAHCCWRNKSPSRASNSPPVLPAHSKAGTPTTPERAVFWSDISIATHSRNSTFLSDPTTRSSLPAPLRERLRISFPAGTATPTAPVELTLWVADDMQDTSGTNAPLPTPRPPVTLTWSKYRGPGVVTFDKAKPVVEKLSPANDKAAFSGKATTNVKFS